MREIYQLDIFGEEHSAESIKDRQHETIKGQFRKMYGFDDAHQCRDCEHLTYTERDRRWYKCSLMGISASAATDIRLGDPACRRWERKVNKKEPDTNLGTEEEK